MTDLYDVLGVKPTASQDEIRKAYKSQAGKCHPDKNQDDPEATVKFQALQKAYGVLKDPEKRKRYDETGAEEDVPSLDESANSCIAQIYLELAERSNFEPKDYLLEVTKATQNSLRQCMSDKKQIDLQYDRLQYLIENTTADEAMLIHLNRKLHEIKHKKAHADEATTVMNRALELLDGYKYTGKTPTAPAGSPFPWTTEPYVGT